MFSPEAMLIESAADALKDVPEFIRTDQLKELRSFGAERAQALGASGISADFQKGYELGLQTARAVLRGSVALNLKGIDPRDVL
jgi:hypothetical protein